MSSYRPQKLGRWYEKEVAKDYSGTKQIMSGAHWSAKSDVKTSEYLIEVKFTTKDSYTLRYEDLIKHFNYAYREGKLPIFQIGFYGGQELLIIEDPNPSDTYDIYVKAGAKSKNINKYTISKISTMLYNSLRLLIIPKKKFKEYEQKILNKTD